MCAKLNIEHSHLHQSIQRKNQFRNRLSNVKGEWLLNENNVINSKIFIRRCENNRLSYRSTIDLYIHSNSIIPMILLGHKSTVSNINAEPIVGTRSDSSFDFTSANRSCRRSKPSKVIAPLRPISVSSARPSFDPP